MLPGTPAAGRSRRGLPSGDAAVPAAAVDLTMGRDAGGRRPGVQRWTPSGRPAAAGDDDPVAAAPELGAVEGAAARVVGARLGGLGQRSGSPLDLRDQLAGRAGIGSGGASGVTRTSSRAEAYRGHPSGRRCDRRRRARGRRACRWRSRSGPADRAGPGRLPLAAGTDRAEVGAHDPGGACRAAGPRRSGIRRGARDRGPMSSTGAGHRAGSPAAVWLTPPAAGASTASDAAGPTRRSASPTCRPAGESLSRHETGGWSGARPSRLS